MIIVKDKNKQNLINLPQTRPNSYSEKFRLELIDRATNVHYIFFGLEDLRSFTYGFYTFNVDFSTVPQGEYEYKLYDSGRTSIFQFGIIRLNELEPDFIAHDINRTYVVYDT